MKSKCPYNIWICIFFQTLQEKDDLKSQASPEGKEDAKQTHEELQENETAATLLSWAASFECRHTCCDPNRGPV